MQIIKSSFGLDSKAKEAFLFTLKNNNNSVVKITNYGGIIVSIIVEDKNKNFDDVVLGYENVLQYEKGNEFFGATIGRYTNLIENARFTLNGKEYILDANNGESNLHGGVEGFDRRFWDYEIKDDSLELSYFSKDGECGFPGNLNVTVTFTLTDDNALKIEYNAVSDADTIVNMTNHSFFNLSGHNSGTILKHRIKINADSFSELDERCIPTGNILQVEGTPFDFRNYNIIGERIGENNPQLKISDGYGHNWIVNGDGLRTFAEVTDDASGRQMEVISDMPCLQFYSGNYLNGSSKGKNGSIYKKRDGLALETQFHPNAINQKGVPNTILKANEKYSHTTIFKFKTV